MGNSEKIDFVITWVDGNDPAWLQERNQYSEDEQKTVDNNPCRFRDWDTLRYWFRGVEQFAPWVNRIYFVTWGHVPEWLNLNHPKLKVVKHSDFIPAEYLPTFNSNVIEFYFHRIEDLSEQFVYFNDDMLLINAVPPTRFFRNGLPCDLASMRSINNKGMFGVSIYLAMMLVNDHFRKRTVMKKHVGKWFNTASLSASFRNALFYVLGGGDFTGLFDPHLPQGYLKSTYEEVWAACRQDLLRVSKYRFRQYGDITSWLLRYWQLAAGRFVPYNTHRDGAYYVIKDDNISAIADCIRQQKKALLCLNDTEATTHFEECKRTIHAAFEAILPSKSSYERM
jgi:hypothetical protein